MLATDKAERLMGFLEGLEESLALRLAKAVELDRLSEGMQLPHALILDGLRPVLRRAAPRPDRTPTPQRLLCGPFEDVLTSLPRKEKLKGRIARTSILPVWNWIARSLLPERTASYVAGIRVAVLDDRLADAEACAREFRTIAGQAVREALGDETGRKVARLALGDENVLADADEMGILLSVAPLVSELQNAMPKPQAGMSDELLWKLRGLYDRLAVSFPDAAPYIAAIAMGRLEKPWEALRLPLLIARQSHDTLISSTDMGLVGELLLADLDAHAFAIRSAKQPPFDPDALIAHVSDFARMSNGIVKEVEMRRDGRWGRRLIKDRAAVAEIMDEMMKRAPREIMAAIPTLKTGAYAGGPRAPDLTRPFDVERGTRAVTYARLLAGCKTLAPAAGFGASLAAANDEACAALKSYSEDILRELRASDDERRARVEKFFALAVELADILFSSEEAEVLRRRGRSAIGAQAAA